MRVQDTTKIATRRNFVGGHESHACVGVPFLSLLSVLITTTKVKQSQGQQICLFYSAVFSLQTKFQSHSDVYSQHFAKFSAVEYMLGGFTS